jgi:hypothetical protein
MSSEERYCHFLLMPTQSEQVISSFLTRFAYEKLASLMLPHHIFSILKADEGAQ